jgi:hypothetical protein
MMKMKACRAENVGYKADFGVTEVKPVQLNQQNVQLK